MAQCSFQICGIAGSLREGSYNRGLLRAAQEVAPEGIEIAIYERLAEIPPFNEDVRLRGEPEPVRDLKAHIRAAHALLIATPEYNYGPPGVLKNAIDWVSRPPMDSPLRFKPIALMGASAGNFGTVRAQLSLRQTFVFTESYVLPKPEVLVFRAQERFDERGRLTDEPTREYVQRLIVALKEWAERLERGKAS